jgi:integrase
MAYAKWKSDNREGRASRVLVARWRDPSAKGGWVDERRPNDRTLAQARDYSRERERQADRIAKGLEIEFAPVTFGDLLDNWWDREGSRRTSDSRHGLKASVDKHFGDLRPFVLSPGTAPAFADKIATRLADKVQLGVLAAQTVNHLRSVVFRAFEIARDPKVRRWPGENPIKWVPRHKVPKRRRETLSPEEIPSVLAEFPEPVVGKPWRWAAAICLYTAARPGEAFGLHKSDVDQHNWTITFRHSWSKPTPKDKEERVVVVPPELRPVIQAAMKDAPGHLVLPRKDGIAFTEKIRFNLVDHLRRACVGAGVVLGFIHTCRRCKARARKGVEGAPETVEWQHQDGEQRVCPTCGMKLWAKAIPRPLRFYDLRHTSGTILRKRHVDLGAVSKMFGHSSPEITQRVYDHSDIEDYRSVIESALTFGAGSPRPTRAPFSVPPGALGAREPESEEAPAPEISRVYHPVRPVKPGAPSPVAIGVQVVAGSNPVAPTHRRPRSPRRNPRGRGLRLSGFPGRALQKPFEAARTARTWGS